MTPREQHCCTARFPHKSFCTSENCPWRLFRSKAKCHSRTLQVPVLRTEGRRAYCYVPDEPPRTCDILRLWDARGGNDPWSNCRKVCLQDPATKVAAAGEGRPVQNDQACRKWRECEKTRKTSKQNKWKPYSHWSHPQQPERTTKTNVRLLQVRWKGWPQHERMRGYQLQMQRLQKVGHLQKVCRSKHKGAESEPATTQVSKEVS